MIRILKTGGLLVLLMLPVGALLTSVPAAGVARAADQKYTCGMHPMIVVDEPGLCPICQMDLTPLKSDSGASHSDQVIVIDPATSQKMGIRTAPVKRRDLVRAIRTIGLVDYEEPAQIAINSKVSGWVEKLYVNETGMAVEKGDPLLDLYSPDLVSAQEELLFARHNLAGLRGSHFSNAVQSAEALLAAARKRLLLWDISPEQIDQLEQSGQVKKTLTLKAPTAGVVSKKQIREGEFIKAGPELLEISDVSKVWVYADIYEYDLPWVAVGHKARIHFPFSRTAIDGRIDAIYPFLEAQTRTIKARISIENPDYLLKPDMYADVEIFAEPLDQVLSIPAEAVLYTGKMETVFVALGEGRFEPRTVEVGVQEDSGFVAVHDGVREGEMVVTSAQFMLDSESKLREALKKMRQPVAPASADPDLEDLFD